MGILNEMTEKFKGIEDEEQETSSNSFMAVIHKIQNVIGIIVGVLYRLRKVFWLSRWGFTH